MLYVLFISLSGIGCPIKFFTGISCPGCGMTRAVLSALHFDFKSAFYYHPLWCIMPLCLPLLVILIIYRKRRAENLCIAIICIAFITVYAVRLALGDSTVVVFEPENGIYRKIFSKIFS